MKKVLYIDDEKINLTLFKFTFQKKYDVILASSGEEGLRKLNEHSNIQIVVSDWKMPEMNGLEFVKKAVSLYENKCFFLLTGLEKNEVVEEYLNEGILNYYFQKPFNRDLLEKHFEICTSNLKIA